MVSSWNVYDAYVHYISICEYTNNFINEYKENALILRYTNKYTDSNSCFFFLCLSLYIQLSCVLKSCAYYACVHKCLPRLKCQGQPTFNVVVF